MASTVNRMAPAVEPDRILDAPAPEECPGCGGATEFERITEQFQTELPEPRPTTTCFNVEVRRCGSCGTRVQGRHPEQTSDALGAAAAQVGPRAMAWGTWLHYSLGLSFAKTSACSGAWVSGSPPGHLFIVGIDDHRSRPHPQRHQGPRRSSAAVVMDETGWRIGGEGVWLWVAATDDSTIYDVARAGALTRPSAWFRPTTPGPSSVTAGSSTTAT